MECALLAPATKLRVDFALSAGLRRDMHDDTVEQIRSLLTRIGMIMEDANGTALTLAPADGAFVEQLDALAKAIDAASILLRAAAVLYAADFKAPIAS